VKLWSHISSVAARVATFIFTDPVMSGWERARVESEKRLRATLACPTVKIILRDRANERLRIYRNGDCFGAVTETSKASPATWRPDQILGAGCVYDSPEAAEVYAAEILPWLRLKSEDVPPRG
jgi:hypothetical protein